MKPFLHFNVQFHHLPVLQFQKKSPALSLSTGWPLDENGRSDNTSVSEILISRFTADATFEFLIALIKGN